MSLRSSPVESQDFSPGSNERDLEALRTDPALVALGLVVVDVLGTGGTAIVYRARDERHGRDVAIKILRRNSGLPHAAARFRQEVQVAAGLRHAHILPLIDSGSLQDGRPFAVMPVARGRPLSAMIREGPLTIVDAVRLTRETAEALAHIHESGFVHRDVKPDNILVEGGHAVLTDFGIATPLTSLVAPDDFSGTDWWKSSAQVDRFTPTGRAVGTLHYMGPELFRAEGPIDGRADVYALGVVLYEMLAAERPFDESSPSRLIRRITRDGVPGIRTRRADVPRELEAVIRRSTAAQPADRFASASAMARALAHVPIGGIQDGPRTANLDRRPLSVAFMVVLAAMIVGFYAWEHERKTSVLDPDRVVVADLVNDTNDPTLGSIGVLAGDVITAALTAGTRLMVVNSTIALPSQQQTVPPVDSILADKTRSLIASTRAGLVVTGAYFRADSDLRFFAEVTDTRSGRVLGAVGPIHGAIQHPDLSLQMLADSVVAILHRRHEPPVP